MTGLACKNKIQRLQKCDFMASDITAGMLKIMPANGTQQDLQVTNVSYAVVDNITI